MTHPQILAGDDHLRDSHAPPSRFTPHLFVLRKRKDVAWVSREANT